MRNFGLIGFPLSHSFSQIFFTDKFKKLNISCNYNNYEIGDLSNLKALISNNQLSGLNVTSPFKTSIIPYLDQLEETGKTVGSLNTILIKDEKLIGYNTDIIGFKISLERIIGDQKPPTLILGTGGSAKAVAFVLKQKSIAFKFVSRNANESAISYLQSDDIISQNLLIINCTPMGRFPQIAQKPPINYSKLTDKHILFDLNYNPEITAFMNEGIRRRCKVCNGYDMLIEQAEASWTIWNYN